MKKQLRIVAVVVIVLITLLISVIVLSGFFKSDADKLLGSWEEQTGQYSWRKLTFLENGRISFNDGEQYGNWTLNNNILTIVGDDWPEAPVEFNYQFSFFSNELTITFAGYSTKYNKI